MTDYMRTPPQSIIAEKNVLGSMMIDKSVIDDVIGDLLGQDFFREDNKEIFETMLTMHTLGEPVELNSLSEKLKSKNILDQVGGLDYLIELIDSVVTVQNVKHYIGLIKEKSTLRQILKQSTENINSCYDESKAATDVLQAAQTSIMNINNNQTSKNVVLLAECLPETMTNLEKRCKNKGNITGLSTGFKDLDYKTGGLQNSDLILVAGRPAMGKTSFGVNIAEYVGIRQQEPVLIFSLEMSRDQLVNRILCSESLIDSHKVKIGLLEDSEWEKVGKSMRPLSEAKLYIDDSSSIKVPEMFAKCRKLKKDKGLALVVIDYIQLMTSHGKNGNREQEVAEISRSLKIMAKELNVPVVALSQLSRGPEQRADHRPMLSDLRESGAIEQDADIVMFLYRDDYYNPESQKKNIAEVILAKHRSGGIGTIELCWLAQYTKFANLEKYKSDRWEPPKETPRIVNYQQRSFGRKLKTYND